MTEQLDIDVRSLELDLHYIRRLDLFRAPAWASRAGRSKFAYSMTRAKRVVSRGNVSRPVRQFLTRI
jgi:hypothetical protein